MPEEFEDFLDVNQIAEMIGWSSATIYQKVEKKQIPHYRFGKAVRFKRSDIEAWADAQRVPVVPTMRTHRDKKPVLQAEET